MENSLLKLFNLVTVSLLLTACSSTTKHNEQPSIEVTETIFYLTRHAEKQKVGGKDPLLSAQGQARAQALADLLQEAPIQKIYTTKYQRTQLTAKPTSDLKQLDIEVSSLPPKLLAAKLKKLHQNESVLIVGHSNTVPEIITAMGVTTPIVIEHKQYGDLYIVKVDNQGQVELELQRYGDTE